jgi:hypothetical protein
MKIEVFEIKSKEDKIYQELLEQYKTNSELRALLNEFILSPKIVLAGDLRLIKMMEYAINVDSIEVYLVKNVDNDTFVWAIGKHLSVFDIDDWHITMYPLLKKQSKALQLAIRKALIEKGLMKEADDELG